MSARPQPYPSPRPVNSEPELARAAQVQCALSQLTPFQSDALTLIYRGHLSQAQVARRLNTTPDSVKLAVGAAFRRLNDLVATQAVSSVP